MGDLVGITCGSRQVNIEYEYTGGENSLFWAKVDMQRIFGFLGTQEYDVTAYYPFTGTSGEEPIAVEVSTNSENQATAAAREQIDFLYAAGKATAETPNVKRYLNENSRGFSN